MLRIPAPVALLVVTAALPVLAVAPASADDPAGALGNVVINEVSSNGYNHGATTNRDFVELYNHGTANVDLSGYHLTDSSGLPASDIVLDGVLPAGGYALIWNNEASAGAAAFGLGGSDRIDLLSPDGATTIDSHSWATHVAPSHARVPDGTGALAVSTAATPGGSNALATADAMVTLNEYSSSTDFVELHNAGPSAVSLEGWSIADGATEVQGDEILFGAGVEIPAGGYLSVPTEGALPAGVTYVAGGFGLNMTDHVWLRNGADALVSTTWVGFEADGVTTRHADPSWARTSQGVGLWKLSATATPGAVNAFPGAVEVPPLDPNWDDVEVNEISSLNDDDEGNPGFGDAVELQNKGANPVSIEGWWQSDGSAAGAGALTLADLMVWNGTALEPAASMVIPAGGQVAFSSKEGLSGEGDGVQVFGPGAVAEDRQPVDAQTYGDGDGGVSDNYESDSLAFAACPNGSDEFWRVTESSFGQDNTTSCATKSRRLASPVVLNEVSNVDGKAELLNTGTEPVDISGWELLDAEDTVVHTVHAATTLAAGAFYLAESIVGLDSADSLTIRRADDQASVIAFTWFEDGIASYSRCELFGEVSYVETPTSTFGAANACPEIDTEPWPGGPTVTTVDAEDAFTDLDANDEGDVSGASFDPNDPTVLWVAMNKGRLFKMHKVGDTYEAFPEWDGGLPLRFADGQGELDAEGVTIGPDGFAYVTSERDNTNDEISYNKIARYDVGSVTAGTTELVATHEWDVNELVVTGTNLGLEGITYVPDALLVEAGWKVGGVAYTAAAHPTPGLFVTAVEGTGDLHFLSLPTGAEPVEVKVEKSGFPFAMDVAYDADREALWAICDDSCGGIYNLLEIVDGEFTIDSYARPEGMPNLNNEGMALAPWSTCVEGVQEVVWADDGDTDGHSLRASTLPCNEFQLENTALPRIQGTPKVGMTLTGTPGGWDPEPGSVAYKWLANGAPIAGATGPKLAVTMALVGKRITLRVTASADGLDDVSEVSAPTAPVAKGTFTVRVRPGIAGKARVGMTLRAVKGAVSPAANPPSYQWLLNGKRIKGATGVTLRLKPKLQGKKVSVRVTFARPGYVAKTLTSKAVRVRQR